MKYLILVLLLLAAADYGTPLFAEEAHVKVGVSTTLTGDAASFGTDIKNALLFANEKFAHNRYEFIFEDDKCTGKDAVAVAHKLISVDKVKYVLGFACNQALLAAAPIYQSAGVVVLTSSATSGDKLDIGDKIFRLFPADNAGAELLYHYAEKKYKKIGILTEQNEYSELMQRAFLKAAESQSEKAHVVTEEFLSDDNDLRSQLFRLKAAGIDALYVNTNAEPTFIRAIKQMGQVNFKPALLASYWPASVEVLKEVAPNVEGIVFSNLPVPEDFLTAAGNKTLADYKKQYGEPASGASVVPITLESFRIFDDARKSGKSVEQYFKSTSFDGGLIGSYKFDEHGAVNGIDFILQTVKGGKVEKLLQGKS